MPRFATARDAKEFLVNRIVLEAEREGVPLSEIETKMMYFSETAWTLPDMEEINRAFEQGYDQAAYEQKIANLALAAQANAKASGSEDLAQWKEAIRFLAGEDHYILVLISAPTRKGRPPGDFLKLIVTALALVALFLVLLILFRR